MQKSAAGYHMTSPISSRLHPTSYPRAAPKKGKKPKGASVGSADLVAHVRFKREVERKVSLKIEIDSTNHLMI
jgi:hypothetical protein